MNLLNTVLGTENQAPAFLSPAEAFAAITLVTTASDGYLSNEQALCLSSVLSRLKLFRSYTDELMKRLFDKILGILRQEGFNSLFNAAKQSLSQDLREAAFAVATDLILAESLVTEDEKNFLTDLSQALGLSSEIAIQIMQVMAIKNQG
ncbi:tellurite resistance TerB family protein [Nostocaceae cyanobacterium CENA357]|uniref:Tellurite resistance TerB family protein n=1 Tax=Atlanticothrix silvestris CENA357 TaxID=1725252 RepID=A0A8J7HI23_9CYAN|nr:tellurite resistance TerB family protein [Atlanticothrix silvestris]MBH8552783.1 tellurite resistance TerB family protein [Atlanticothrix silvestris CENA357]